MQKITVPKEGDWVKWNKTQIGQVTRVTRTTFKVGNTTFRATKYGDWTTAGSYCSEIAFIPTETEIAQVIAAQEALQQRMQRVAEQVEKHRKALPSVDWGALDSSTIQRLADVLGWWTPVA